MPWSKWGEEFFIPRVGRFQWWRRWDWKWDNGVTRTPRHFGAGPRHYGWYKVWTGYWWREVVMPVSPVPAAVTPEWFDVFPLDNA